VKVRDDLAAGKLIGAEDLGDAGTSRTLFRLATFHAQIFSSFLACFHKEEESDSFFFSNHRLMNVDAASHAHRKEIKRQQQQQRVSDSTSDPPPPQQGRDEVFQEALKNAGLFHEMHHLAHPLAGCHMQRNEECQTAFKSVRQAFEVWGKDVSESPPGHQKTRCHMTFDVKT
jgi:hypothetical protein